MSKIIDSNMPLPSNAKYRWIFRGKISNGVLVHTESQLI